MDKHYMFCYHKPLSSRVAQALWLKERMPWSVFAEILRELRFLWPLHAPCSCPWGWILLAIVLAFLGGCCLRACLAICAWSPSCRRGLRLFGSLVVSGWLTPEGAAQELAIRRRLGQYRDTSA